MDDSQVSVKNHQRNRGSTVDIPFPLYLYALSIILSLSFFPPHLTTTLRKRSRKYIPFSNAYIYIYFPAPRKQIDFVFLSGRGATNAGIFASSQVEIDIRNNSARPREF